MAAGAPARGEASDRDLIELARRGEEGAVAELWERHHDAAMRAAKSFTSIDAEDLVSEAYLVILDAFRRGGGPVGEAFRPYLYTVVRNLARRWGGSRHEINVEELPEEVGEDDVLRGQLGSLDERLVREAFKSLPSRWREVLWYAEVERLQPAEIAPIVGLTANATAALAYRAREGLRQAWLQAHIADAQREGECGWVLARIGEHSRDAAGKRAADRIDRHLRGCRSCRDTALEVGQVNRQLAVALIPAVLGLGAGVTWLAAFSPAASATAATGSAVVGASTVGGTSAAAGTGIAGAATVTGVASLSSLGAVSVVAAGITVLGGLTVLGVAADAETRGAGTTPESPSSIVETPPETPSLAGLDEEPQTPGPLEAEELQPLGTVQPVTGLADDVVNDAGEVLGDAAAGVSGGAIELDIDSDLSGLTPSLDLGAGIGGIVDTQVGLGGDGLLSVDVGTGLPGVDDLLGVTVGGEDGLLGLDILGGR